MPDVHVYNMCTQVTLNTPTAAVIMWYIITYTALYTCLVFTVEIRYALCFMLYAL